MCVAADSLTAAVLCCVYGEDLRFDEITITKRQNFSKFNRKQLAICYHFYFFLFLYVYIMYNIYMYIIKRNSILDNKKKKKKKCRFEWETLSLVILKCIVREKQPDLHN